MRRRNREEQKAFARRSPSESFHHERIGPTSFVSRIVSHGFDPLIHGFRLVYSRAESHGTKLKFKKKIVQHLSVRSFDF
jgi:hypothetical protein